MKPGRELDALVAEKVMGWRLEERGYVATFWVDENGKVKRAAEPCSIDFCSCEVFSPSTDISDAWKVVEKLGIIPNSFYIGYKTDKNGKKIYRAFFQKENPITTLIYTYEADAETAPLAICLAALKAVGVEVE
jgi:hypothetical protein